MRQAEDDLVKETECPYVPAQFQRRLIVVEERLLFLTEVYAGNEAPLDSLEDV